MPPLRFMALCAVLPQSLTEGARTERAAFCNPTDTAQEAPPRKERCSHLQNDAFGESWPRFKTTHPDTGGT